MKVIQTVRRFLKIALPAACLLLASQVQAQELDCKITFNTRKVQGTSTQVFKTLETALTEFMNSKKWTNQQYAESERIACTFNITVNSYNSDGTFSCEMMVQSSRPVYNASYNTTTFNFKDADFGFNYQEYDQIQFQDDMIDNSLTAVMAYYAYLLIGLDMDSMSLLGGTEVLQKAENVVNNAQMLNATGWKAFDSDRNRHAIINDYMDGGMRPFREMMYKYYREGLDQMSTNADRGRTNITEAMKKLEEAKANKPLSALPVIFTDIKRDEFVNIYSKGTTKEKEEVFEILSEINPSQSTQWNKIKSAR